MDDTIENDDVIVDDCDATMQGPSGAKTTGVPGTFRKFRTNSYHRAISTPPKLQRSDLSSVSESPPAQSPKRFSLDTQLQSCNISDSGSHNNRPRDLLYQEVKEKGIFSDVVENDDDITNELEGKSLLRRNRSDKQRKSFRRSWGAQSKVQQSLILETMNPKERKRQEAMFELMTSESSYLRSLNVLVDCYKSSPELRATVTSTEYHHLFSNIDAVRKACWRFHHALSKRRKSSSVVINDVCDIVLEFVKAGTFAPYVTYCSNEIYQQRVLLRLMKENQEFVRVLRRLEKNEQCAGLPLHSFLLLPMQRITRIPLLIDTIRQRCEVSSPYYSIASEALKETTSLVKTCNEQARSLERTEEMIQLQTQLEFKCSRSFALVSASRYVVKRGPLLKVSEDVVFGFRRLTKQEIYLFLFNDVILVTKRKNDESYSVTDYCYKERLKSRDVINDPFSFVIIMERTQDGQRIELKLEADKPNEKSRWMAALSRNKSFGQPISKEAMQVLIIKSVRAEEPDMISLKNMDVCVVLYTTSDGWIYGERMSDGCRGWFSSGGAKEILNSKVREQNLYRRARLLGQPTVV